MNIIENKIANKINKNLIAGLIAILTFFSIFSGIRNIVINGATSTPIIDSGSLAVEDIKTKSIVFRKNAGEKIKIGNLVSIIGAMTLYEKGELGNDKEKVADLIENQNLTHMDYFAKKKFKSNDEFIKAMNLQITKLGCKDTKVYTIDGKSNKDVTTIADLSMILGKAIDLGYKDNLKFETAIEDFLSSKGKENNSASKKTKSLAKSTTKDDNKIYGTKFINSKEKGRVYTVIAGIKKGNIFVAIGYGGADEKSSTDDVANSLDYTMNIYRSFKVVGKGEKVGEIKVKGGRKSYCKVIATEDMYVTLPQEGEDTLVKKKLEIAKEMTAPVEKDKIIGKIKALEAGEATAEVNVATGEAIVKGGPWSKIGISDYMMAIGSAVIIVLLILALYVKRKRYKKRKRIEEIKKRRREEEARRIAIEREEKRRRNWPY